MKKNFISTIVAGIGTTTTYLIGGWDSVVMVLALLIVIDYLTGVMKAYSNKELSSETGSKGLMKKAGIFLVIIVAHQLDNIVGADSPVFRTMAIYFYIGNEGISILENLALLGIPLPVGLGDALKKLKEKNRML